MIFSTYRLLVLGVCSSLCALSAAEIPATNGGKRGLSVKAVRLAPPEEFDQPGLHRRGNDQITVNVGKRWYIPVQLGTPPQSFLMTTDTGAPSLAVKGVFLPQNETGGSPVYDPSKSTTATKLNGYTYENCYVSGHCGTGVLYNDTVTVGNVSIQMAFEVSTNDNGVSNGDLFNSGDFGLNFGQSGMPAKPNNIPSWLQTILPLCSEQVFTIDFNETTSSTTFDFGYIDNSKYNGDVGYAPVISKEGAWEISFSGFQVGANGTFNNSQGWNAMVDSGTEGFHLPSFVVDGYFQQIPGAKYDSSASTYRFPCSTVLPDFVFGIVGDSTYRGAIPLSAIKVSNGTCVSILVASSGGTLVYGQKFIESQFVIFDYANGRVGFANKDTSITTTPTTTASPTLASTPSTATASTSIAKNLAAAKENPLRAGWLSSALFGLVWFCTVSLTNL